MELWEKAVKWERIMEKKEILKEVYSLCIDKERIINNEKIRILKLDKDDVFDSKIKIEKIQKVK